MSLVVTGLASLGVAGAVVFGVWARSARDRAVGLAAMLEARLAEQQRSAERRGGLLRTVVEATPVAMVLCAYSGNITFANRSARDLFFGGVAVEGQSLLSMIERAPLALRRALLLNGDELFSVGAAGGPETFHLSRQHLEDGQTLISVRNVTQEVNRHEVVGLKAVIRSISSEINNSLGPISSLVGSARVILPRPEHLPKLQTVLDTIQERAVHLQSFLEGHARLAKIREPQPVIVARQIAGAIAVLQHQALRE